MCSCVFEMQYAVYCRLSRWLMTFNSRIIFSSFVFNVCLPSLISSVEIIRAERLRVVDLTSHSAVLQWRPVLSENSSYYELWYKSVSKPGREIRRTLTGDSSRAELKNLQPDTTYTASLRPESNQAVFNTLTVTFTTFPGKKHLMGKFSFNACDSIIQ